ncbi:MFS transporter [Zymomonas sp.]|uniref:MFS transporter n=1 Tax=Zymomonas sp. TaxID=2068624 RepID=UPI0025F1F94C|nr:MFS transporter [Zymomonas sp.]MCA1956457.1 MFS transporter [Zymomonas sp.]
MNHQILKSPAPLSAGAIIYSLLPFILILFLGYLTIGLPLAVLPLYMHDYLGLSPVTIGWVMASQSMATLLTRPLSGVVTDVRGSKPAVFMGLLFCSLAAVTYGGSVWVKEIPSMALILLFIGRAILGFGESLLITGILAWCMAIVGARHTGQAMVWVGIAMFSAIGSGAPMGVVLLKWGGFERMVVIAAILPLLACFSVKFMKPIPPVRDVRLSFFAVVGEIWSYGSSLALSTIGFGAMFAFLGLDYAAHHWTSASFGLTAFGLSYVAVRLVFGGLPDRLGGLRVARVTIPLQIMGLILLWLASSSWVAFIGCAVLGGGYSLTFPALGVEAVRSIPPQNRGAAMGAYVAFVDIGLGLAGPSAGLVASNFGYPSVFFMGACASFLAMIFIFGLSQKQQNIEDVQP